MPQRTTFAEGSEPDLLSTLLDQYIVECRFAGRTPGTSLYLAHAVRRDGTRTEMVDNQKFKLFLESWLADWGWYKALKLKHGGGSIVPSMIRNT